MHILIAGGAGFVGSSLALLLRQHHADFEITCLDNLSRKGSALNVPRLQAAGISFCHADTRFANQLDSGHPVDIIIDAAAEPSVLAGLDHGLDYLVETNFNGTVHLLNLARKYGAGFIFLSTSRVYPIRSLSLLALEVSGTRFALAEKQDIPGVTAQGISESFPLNGARSLYGATKLASELMVEEYRAAFGIRTIINRCGIIAGPWQMGKVDQGVLALWVARHFWQKPLQYIGFGGTGLQVRDMLHVHDLFRLIEIQLSRFDALSGGLYNVGGGPGASASLAELTALCEEITGNRIEITRTDSDRPGDVPWYITNNALVERDTGWRPNKAVRHIVEDTFEWIKEHEAILKPIFA